VGQGGKEAGEPDPLALIADIQRRLGHLATFVTLRAGKRYSVDTETGSIKTIAM
jgi:hypothetical protein